MTIIGLEQKLEFGAFGVLALGMLYLPGSPLKYALIQVTWRCIIIFRDGTCSCCSAVLVSCWEPCCRAVFSKHGLWAICEWVIGSVHKKYIFSRVIDQIKLGEWDLSNSILIKLLTRYIYTLKFDPTTDERTCHYLYYIRLFIHLLCSFS